MATITVNPQLFLNLKGKTVIITGGANGIGKTTSKKFHEFGANVVIADLDTKGGQELADSFNGSGLFHRTDVTDWQSLLSLFKTAFERFGSIDHVCANAGVPEQSNFLLEDRLDQDGQLLEPNFKLLDVNVNGVLRTSKLAIHYFAKNKVPGGSLVVTGSAASYFGAAPIFVYDTGKHAVLGLVRSLALFTRPSNVRVNLVAPWMTETEFNTEVREIWGDMPMNTQDDVATALLVASADPSLHGRGIWVANKELTDLEKPLRDLQVQWLGEENSKLFDKGSHRLAKGMGLPTEDLGVSHLSTTRSI